MSKITQTRGLNGNNTAVNGTRGSSYWPENREDESGEVDLQGGIVVAPEAFLGEKRSLSYNRRLNVLVR